MAVLAGEPPARSRADSVSLLEGLKDEQAGLAAENAELQQLVEEARALCEQAEAMRSRPPSAAAQRDEEEQLIAEHDRLRRRAVLCGSRPSSAGSARSYRSVGGICARPYSATIRKPISRPVSATHMRGGDGQRRGAVMAAAVQAAEETFEVVLDRSGGASLGMKIRTAGEFLEVTKVKDEGLVHQWNAGHFDQAVEKGDLVYEVNGKRGDADTLFQECSQNAVLRLVVARGNRLMRQSMSSPDASPAKSSDEDECISQLRALLERHDRAVLSNLDSLLMKFRGRESDLYRSLCKKYGETPLSH